MSTRARAKTWHKPSNPPVIDPPVGPPALPPGVITSFTLRSASTGTWAFQLGHAFRKGDVPSGQGLVLDSTTQQCTPLSFWDDGSVKHALLAGTQTLTANTNRGINVARGTPPTGGTVLTENTVRDAASPPQATVSFGTAGTVSLFPLIGTAALVLTEHAGTQYIALQYAANFPSDSGLRAVFYVQWWLDGTYRVRVAVENGTAPAVSTSKSGACTIMVNNVTIFSGSVTMPNCNRFDAVGSNRTVAGTLHDVQYLRSTKLWPNYGFLSIPDAEINKLQRTYTPMNGMDWVVNMGDPGFGANIGLVSHWDAMYMATGDQRAYDSLIAHDRAYGIYAVFARDATTRRMPKFSDHPTAYANDESLFAGIYRWEFAHSPNAGYTSWLCTAERYFLEVMHATSWACYFTQNFQNSPAPFQNALRAYTSQTRGRAWRARTIGASAAVSPQGDPVATDCRANLRSNLQRVKQLHVDTNNPGTGLCWINTDNDDNDPQFTFGFQHSIFESCFVASTMSFLWDIEPGFSATDRDTLHKPVRDYTQRVPVGLTGRGQAFAEYNYRRAPGVYRMSIGPNEDDNTTLYNSWGQVENHTWNSDGLSGADGLSLLGSAQNVTGFADDPDAFAFPQGNWGHILTALSYSVDHSAPGAQAGFTRLTTASNWNSNAIKYNNWPMYGVLPRAPAWYSAQAAGGWKNLGTTHNAWPGKHPISFFSGDAASVSEQTSVGQFSYSGGFINQRWFYTSTGTKLFGASVSPWGGGHNASGDNGMTAFRLQDLTWYRIRTSYPNGVYSTSNNADGTPNSRHTYQSIVWVPTTNEMFSACTGARLSQDGSSGRFSHTFDFKNTTPNGAAPGPWTQNPDFPLLPFTHDITGICAVYDTDADRIVCWSYNQYRFSYFDVKARTWSLSTPDPAGTQQISSSDRLAGVYIPGKRWVVSHQPAAAFDDGRLPGLRVADSAAASPRLVPMVTGGSPPDASAPVGLTWDPLNGRVVSCDRFGTLRVCTPPATINGTWTWSLLANNGESPDPGGEPWLSSGAGIWGRFGYVDDGVLRGYLLLAGPDSRPAFYKLG